MRTCIALQRGEAAWGPFNGPVTGHNGIPRITSESCYSVNPALANIHQVYFFNNLKTRYRRETSDIGSQHQLDVIQQNFSKVHEGLFSENGVLVTSCHAIFGKIRK